MTIDFSDVDPYQGYEPIPDGTFAKLTLTIRPGGVDGTTPADQGLLKASKVPGSDVLSLDCQFVILEGPHAGRSFWQQFTISGGKVDQKGVSTGWTISKRIFRAMIDSALGLDPDDKSQEAQSKRQLQGLADLDGMTFIAKITVEPNTDPRYPDQNRLDRPVLANEPEWALVMQGQEVPPIPPQRRSSGSRSTAQPTPAWQRKTPATAAPHAPAAAPQAAPKVGPAWLNS